MALSYLKTEEKEDSICDSSSQQLVSCAVFQEGLWFCPVFCLGLQREGISKYSGADDVCGRTHSYRNTENKGPN